MDLIVTGVVAGVLGTLVMDSLNFLFARAGMVSKIDVGMIGRMAAGWAHGRFRYGHPSEIDQVEHEMIYGCVTHYTIGVGLAVPFVLGWDFLVGGPASPVWALSYGIATTVASLFSFSLPWGWVWPAGALPKASGAPFPVSPTTCSTESVWRSRLHFCEHPWFRPMVEREAIQNVLFGFVRLKWRPRMSRKAAQTGPGAMVLVAVEQYFPEAERIIIDDLARQILPFPFRAEVQLIGPIKDWVIRKSEAKVPGLWGGIMGRKRYIDDKVIKSADGHIDAVVNLGAGCDTRAFRLPALAEVPVWEVDQLQNTKSKRSRLEKLFQQVPDHVTLVPIDFDHEDLGTVLAAHGYEPDMKTVFIWEGVTQYVTESGIRATLDFLSRAPEGSRLVFTYTPKDFIEGKVFYGQEFLYQKMLLKDKLWLFGMDPDNVDDVLGEYGWRVVEHLGYDELDMVYVKPTGRELHSMAIERIVHAEKL